jgi:hypothetical protein
LARATGIHNHLPLLGAIQSEMDRELKPKSEESTLSSNPKGYKALINSTENNSVRELLSVERFV